MKRMIPIFVILLSIMYLRKLNLSTSISSRASPSLLPYGPLYFDLDSNNPLADFFTSDFLPESPHIGYYSIHIIVRVYISSERSSSDIRIRNLWNACDIVYKMSYKEMYDKSFPYTYHRPSINDPDFSVAIELHNNSATAKGWIYIYFKDDGIATPPINFIMPSDQTCDSIQTINYQTSTVDTSSSSDDSSFPTIASYIGSLTVTFLYILYRHKMIRKW
ncbi:MAG: hypothetical protein ACFFCQ_17070 [Promethearchaeota archaeon]